MGNLRLKNPEASLVSPLILHIILVTVLTF